MAIVSQQFGYSNFFIAHKYIHDNDNTSTTFARTNGYVDGIKHITSWRFTNDEYVAWLRKRGFEVPKEITESVLILDIVVNLSSLNFATDTFGINVLESA